MQTQENKTNFAIEIPTVCLQTFTHFYSTVGL